VSQKGVPFLDVPPEDRSWDLGEVSPTAGRAAVCWLEHAVSLALQGGVDGVVFAPLNKQAIMRAGYKVPDEYDLMAEFAGVRDHAEMNVIPHPAGRGFLWVARATSHLPFRDVHQGLTKSRILDTIRSAHRAATSTGSVNPRVGISALNPHAGEGGLLGDEETRVIRPAIEAAVSEGIDASGPYPADRIFPMARSGKIDVVVSMYHDQAQIATKLLAFDRGVTVATGFPFVLATPSHGTAFDIVGQGVADPGAMIQALHLTETLAESRSS
jgi:4-hydroxythreonine-4-phosphate dehydrogenase